MMTASPLTVGAIQRICRQSLSSMTSSGSTMTLNEPISLQVIQIKQMDRANDANPNSIRYKLVFSDSVNSIQGIASGSINPLLDNKAIDLNTVIQLNTYGIQVIRGHWILKLFEINQQSLIKMSSRLGGNEPQPIEQAFPAPDSAASTNTTTTTAAFGGVTNSQMPMNTGQSTQQQPATSMSQGGFMAPPNPSRPQPIPGASHSAQQPARSQLQQTQLSFGNQQPQSGSLPPPIQQRPSTSLAFNAPTQQVASAQQRQPPITSLRMTPVKKVAIPITPGSVIPISGLTPYSEGWAIKARVSSRSEVKTWVNAKGEGKLFSVTLVDGSGEIKATAFNDQVDQFFVSFNPDSVILLSGGQVKTSKRAFNTTKNEYEISLNAQSVIEPCTDAEARSIPSAHYSLNQKIKDLGQAEKDSIIDIAGVVKECSEITSIMTKRQEQLSKRDLTIVDDSLYSIRVTFWGSRAEDYDSALVNLNPVIVIKGAKISDFQGKCLGTLSSSTVLVNPGDIPQALTLKTWWDRVGRNTGQFIPLSGQTTGTVASNTAVSSIPAPDKTIAQMIQECTGQGGFADYAMVTATISSIRDNITYAACPTEGCGKKVIEDGPNTFRCDRCGQSFDHCEPRYMYSLQILDDSGSVWVSGFNDSGQTLFGCSASEMHDLKAFEEPTFQQRITALRGQQWTFKVRARQDNYQGDQRVRYNIVQVMQPGSQPLNTELDRMLFSSPHEMQQQPPTSDVMMY